MSTVTSGTPTIVKAIFNGNNGAGAISVAGLLVGDVLLQCIPSAFAGGFEPVVTINDQLQQGQNLDWSPAQLTMYFLRGV